MGLFGDLDVANAKDITYLFDSDTYPAIVSNFEVKPTKAGTMTGMNITYTFTDGKYKGRFITEWQRVPAASDTSPLDPQKAEDAVGYVKKRLASLGVPQERMNTVEPGEIIGTEVYVSIGIKHNKKTNEDENKVTKVVTKRSWRADDGRL